MKDDDFELEGLDDFLKGLVDDFQVIIDPSELGLYVSCDVLIDNLEFAINSGCWAQQMTIEIDGQEKKLPDVTVGLGEHTKDSVLKQLASLKETPDTTSAHFAESAYGDKIIRGTQKYLVIADPNEVAKEPFGDDNYIPIPQEPFLAFAKPKATISKDGVTKLEWIIDNIRDVDLSGKGAPYFNYLQKQTEKFGIDCGRTTPSLAGE